MSGNRPFQLRLARALWWLASDRNYRSMAWLRLTRPRGVFQPNNDTSADRYPAILRFVQSQLGAERDVRILSFGCSIGEEVFSLRGYFPRAVIKGIDINPLNIAACRKRLRRTRDPASHSRRPRPRRASRRGPTTRSSAWRCCATANWPSRGPPAATI